MDTKPGGVRDSGRNYTVIFEICFCLLRGVTNEVLSFH